MQEPPLIYRKTRATHQAGACQHCRRFFCSVLIQHSPLRKRQLTPAGLLRAGEETFSLDDRHQSLLACSRCLQLSGQMLAWVGDGKRPPCNKWHPPSSAVTPHWSSAVAWRRPSPIHASVWVWGSLARPQFIHLKEQEQVLAAGQVNLQVQTGLSAVSSSANKHWAFTGHCFPRNPAQGLWPRLSRLQ